MEHRHHLRETHAGGKESTPIVVPSSLSPKKEEDNNKLLLSQRLLSETSMAWSRLHLANLLCFWIILCWVSFWLSVRDIHILSLHAWGAATAFGPMEEVNNHATPTPLVESLLATNNSPIAVNMTSTTAPTQISLSRSTEPKLGTMHELVVAMTQVAPIEEKKIPTRSTKSVLALTKRAVAVAVQKEKAKVAARDAHNFPDWRMMTSSNDYEPFSIFYQIFVPPDNRDNPDGLQNALRIVREQMKQVRSAIKTYRTETNVTSSIRLYYLTMGQFVPSLVNQTQFQADHCDPALSCHHLRHVWSGSEDATLQHLHDYCAVQRKLDHPEQHARRHQVVYLHSKGSYHWSPKNERWRYSLAAAALHPSCLNPPRESCNTCGMMFFAQWTPFYPGNMWSADCSYVTKLIPPNEFESAVDDAVGEILGLKHRGLLKSYIFWGQMNQFGLDRFHSEHWIGSHPELKPCDMSTTRDFSFWRTGEPQPKLTSEHFSLSPGPRHKGEPLSMNNSFRNVPNSKREIFFLPGMLIKYSQWYQQYPKNDSWVWSFFPDGAFWKDAVNQYGNVAVPMTLTKGVTDVDRMFSTGLRITSTETLLHQASKVGGNSQQQYLTIFLHLEQVSKLASDNNTTVVNALDQLGKMLNSANTPISLQLTYFLAGFTNEEATGEAITQHSLCSTRFCQKGGSRFPGDRLEMIHQYCQARNRDLVLHVSITNKESPSWVQDHSKGEGVLSSIEATANCPTCLQQNTCDVCGRELLVGADLAYRDNTWVAQCSYINKLLRPRDYVAAVTTEVRNRVLVRERGDRIHMKLLKRHEYFPSAEDLLDNHWITSHPTVRPQSVHTTDSSLWTRLSDNSIPAQWKLLKTQKSWRLRECAFLGCYMVRWNLLYGEMPPATSFIWNSTLFPDSSLWRNKIATASEDWEKVFHQVVAPFVNEYI